MQMRRYFKASVYRNENMQGITMAETFYYYIAIDFVKYLKPRCVEFLKSLFEINLGT